MAIQRHLSKKARKDPTGSIRVEKKYQNGITPLINNFKGRVIQDFTHAWETGKIRSLEVGKLDPSKFYPHIDELAEQEIAKPAKKVVEKIVPMAYDQGQVFASIQLGAPLEERQRTWKSLATLIENNQSEFKGFSEAEALRIKRIIGDGIIQEKTLGQITRDIQAEFEMSQDRAVKIINTETMKAVNKGVMDRYKRAGLEPSGHGKIPPLHPRCRCTVITKLIDGILSLVWLAAADERVCPDCEALDGTVV